MSPLLSPGSRFTEESFAKLNPIAQKLIRTTNEQVNNNSKYLIGRLFTFMESMGGSEEVIKARKDMVFSIVQAFDERSYEDNVDRGQFFDKILSKISTQILSSSGEVGTTSDSESTPSRAIIIWPELSDVI